MRGIKAQAAMTNARNQKGKLPQTGDKKTDMAALGLLALGIAGLVTLFGFGKKKK